MRREQRATRRGVRSLGRERAGPALEARGERGLRAARVVEGEDEPVVHLQLADEAYARAVGSLKREAEVDEEVAKLEKALGINLKNGVGGGGNGPADDLPSPAAVTKALLAK